MKKNLCLFGIIALCIVVFDQLTKWAVHIIEVGESIELAPGFLKLGHFINYGASFGMLQKNTGFLVLFSVVVIALIAYYYKQIPVKYDIFVAMILGGTIGNLLDRIFRGYVVDFIDFTFWPAFNIADMAVTIGAVALIIMLMRDKQDRTIHIVPSKRNKRKIKKRGNIF